MSMLNVFFFEAFFCILFYVYCMKIYVQESVFSYSAVSVVGSFDGIWC